MKIVVFDLDETLGYFTQFGVFLDCVQELYPQGTYQPRRHFGPLLDLFPEFLRPELLPLLRYLKQKKSTQCCAKIVIYTNNQGPREWAQQIVAYLEQKVAAPHLFDQIIAAYKIRGQRVELCRTTSDKTHQDFLRCTRVPADAQICFVDDLYHPAMSNDRIYYIHVKPYYCDVTPEEMARRLEESHILPPREGLQAAFLRCYRKHRYDVHPKSAEDLETDTLVGKQVLQHLKKFFNQRAVTHGTRGRRTRHARNNVTRRR